MECRALWLPIVLLMLCTFWADAAIAPPPAQPAPKCCNYYFSMNFWSISYPAYAKPSVEKDTLVTMHNEINTDLIFSSVVKYEDSCKGPGCLSGWLGISSEPTVIHPGETDTMLLKLNMGGVITNATAPHRLWGRIVYTFNGDWSPFTFPISLVVADSVADVKFDTIATMADIKLVVGSNGNAGNNYAKHVNMNWNPPVECDTGSNSRGDAGIYLGDASPVILRKVGSDPVRASWSIFAQGYTNPNGFKPLAHDKAPLYIAAPKWQQYFSGTFTTVDSLLKVEKTWYAPISSTDTGNFILEKLQIWPTTAGTAVTNLAIGQVYDWDVPTDSGTSNNAGGYDATRRLVWQRGFEAADSINDCWNNSYRYAGSSLWRQSVGASFMDNCTMLDTLYAGYTARNDSFVYPQSGFVPEQLWTNMQPKGYHNTEGAGTWTDLHSVLVFRSAADTGWTLPATTHDTLTVYTIMAVVRNAVSEAAGLDSLKSAIDRAKTWAGYWVANCRCCGCVGKRGNVNQSGVIDSADLAALVSYLTKGGYVLPCYDCANVNGEGIVDSADLAALVSYLTGGGFVLPNCP
jgi:hypothetical protein